MDWISVKDKLPPEGRYLCIVKYFETVGAGSAIYTTPKNLLADCYFDPSKGWTVSKVNHDVNVLYWIPFPELPKEADE